MPLQVKENGMALQILLYLDAANDVAETIFASPHTWRRWALHGKHSTYKSAVYRLIKAGLLEIIPSNDEKYLRLTKQGKVQVLMAKTFMAKPLEWDGKWRMVFFDVPEDNANDRHELRRLLLKNGFKKMQASVYICPWPINREAIEYLKETGLINFIKFGRMEELDDDTEYRKMFNI